MEKSSFAKNRAEEIGYDVWDDFVIPPYFNELANNSSLKPKIIRGGRGTGKTMIIRYLSYFSAFSAKRSSIPKETLEQIGVYWRVDTQFASTMQKRGLEEDVWESAFNHFIVLKVSFEILKSLETIAASSYSSFAKEDLLKLNFDELKDFMFDADDFQTLSKELKSKLNAFHLWLSNIRRLEYPNFLPKEFLDSLVSIIHRDLPIFKNSIFFVYLDEYENLLGSQQRIINTWLKHSEPPIIFNLAMKRNAFKERGTLGNEQLSEIHDLRTHDLEEYFEKDYSFELFAAEILFFRLKSESYNYGMVDESLLKSYTGLTKRAESSYRREIVDRAKEVFPSISRLEAAEGIFKDETLRKRLFSLTKVALEGKGSRLSHMAFLDDSFPEASLLMPFLLSRAKPSSDEILIEFGNYKLGLDSKFRSGSGDVGWLHNIFYGALIAFYAPLNRTCPIYSGFGNFLMMSKGNLRHFLELCFRAIDEDFLKTVDIDHQLEASRQTSTALLSEIKSFGKSGYKLYTFILRLGYLMHQAHKRKTQSEPEMTHFAIKGGGTPLTEEERDVLNEAVKWSVLYEDDPTKEKDQIDSGEKDYLLNPIYAPYFKISFRKGRKLSLQSNELKVLISGDIDSYKSVVKIYSRKWSLDPSDETPLFAQIDLF